MFNSYNINIKVPRWSIKSINPNIRLDGLTVFLLCFKILIKRSWCGFRVPFSCMNLPKNIHGVWSSPRSTFHMLTWRNHVKACDVSVSSMSHKKSPPFSPHFFFRNRFCSILRRFCLQKQQGCPTQKRYKSLQCWFTNQRNIPSTIDHWGGDFQKLDFIPEGILALGYYLWLWFVSQAVILRWMFPHDPARIFHRLCGTAFCRYEMQSSTNSHLVIARVPNL